MRAAVLAIKFATIWVLVSGARRAKTKIKPEPKLEETK